MTADRSAATGVELIAAERQRQIDEEGWTPEHDATHTDDALALAAATYALPAAVRELNTLPRKMISRKPLRECLWPWHPSWWKPTPTNRVRELVKAGALVAAEIDRLQRSRRETR